MAETQNTERRIRDLVGRFVPITLEEMSEIRLMNRTDIKFVTNKEKLAELLRLADGKYYAQYHDGTRIATYMTTYWDTVDHLFFMEHHNGRTPRQKIRVRTYLDNGNSFLEVKTKNNHGRTKKRRIQVPDQEELAGGDEFITSLTSHSLQDIHPTVRNRFHRITLVNYGKTERLTIDFDVEFDNLETAEHTGTGQLVVIELKRDSNARSPIMDILRQLRIKPAGFSKYCIGSVLTNPGLKHNLFKPKLVTINRLVNRVY